MESTALTPVRSKSCYGFYRPWAEFEPANLESNGKHANHWTTEGDMTLDSMEDGGSCRQVHNTELHKQFIEQYYDDQLKYFKRGETC
jgi:hypothetical protein